MPPRDTVRIHYRRPPDREEVFVQYLVHESPRVKVTLARGVDLHQPVRVDGDIVLDPGADAVWFTFPGAWHDIGRFHRLDGSWTGIYANILTPPDIRGSVWWTTDLFLDVWQDPGGALSVLDRDQFDAARVAGWIGEDEARRAEMELRTVVEAAERGEWPPPIVSRWTRERALRVLLGE